jgi:hypothetical protein
VVADPVSADRQNIPFVCGISRSSFDMMVAGTPASEAAQSNEKGGQAGCLFRCVHDKMKLHTV